MDLVTYKIRTFIRTIREKATAVGREAGSRYHPTQSLRFSQSTQTCQKFRELIVLEG